MTDAEMADWQYRNKNELDADLIKSDEVHFEVAEPLQPPPHASAGPGHTMSEEHTLWSVARPDGQQHRFSLVSEHEELRFEAQATISGLGGEVRASLETRELTLDELKGLAQVLNAHIEAVEQGLEEERLHGERLHAERTAEQERRRYTHPIILSGSLAKANNRTLTNYEATLHLRECRYAPDTDSFGRPLGGIRQETTAEEARRLAEQYEREGQADIPFSEVNQFTRTLVALKVCKVCQPIADRTGESGIDLDSGESP